MKHILIMLTMLMTTLQGWSQSVEITIGSAKYSTYYCEQALSFESFNGSLKAFTVTGMQGGKVILTKMDVVPSYTPFVIKSDAVGTFDVPVVENDDYFSTMLVGVLTATTISPTSGKYTNFVLANGENGVGFYTLSQEGTLAANKAYLRVLTSNLSSNANCIGMEEVEDTDGMSRVNADNQENGCWYSLQGIAVETPNVPGIYVRNGKKYVVRKYLCKTKNYHRMKKIYQTPDMETVEINLINSLLQAGIGETASPTEGPGTFPDQPPIDPSEGLSNSSPIWDETEE